MAEQTSSEDSSESKITILQNTIEQLHVNRLIYEEQAALYGPLNVPPYIKNAISQISEDLVRKEAELEQLRSGEDNQLPHNTELKRFWGPFVKEGTKFYVPYDLPKNASKTKISVLALSMQAIFNMHRLLVGHFADSFEISRIRLEVGGVIKSDTKLEGVAASTHPHLIVYGAPGANPLANYLMAQFKGISLYEHNTIVRQGYVFRVSGDYLGSPFIVSETGLKQYSAKAQAAMQNIGIYDLQPDQAPRYFPRTFERYEVPSRNDQDCAVVVTGWASLPGENRIRRVIIIAGHSRHSTLFAAAFVATNEEWARQVNALNYFNTETIVGLQPDSSSGPVAPSILAEPREIFKQPLHG